MVITSRWATAACAIFVCSCAPVHQDSFAIQPDHRELRIGVTDEPDSLNPLFSHTAVADDVTSLLFAPVFRYDARGDLLPELVERIPTHRNGDISPDGRTVLLRFRPHLRWADGANLDARDLRFTWRAVLDDRNAVKLRGGWQNIEAIDVPRPLRAIVRLRRPDATLLSLFADGGDAAYPPLPAHLLAKEASLNTARFNSAPLASGPWKLASWQHGAALRFVPNPLYWRGTSALQELRLVVLPDSQTLVAAFQSHDVDLLLNVPAERIPELSHRPGVLLQQHAVAAYRHLDFQCSDPILADVRVREAIVEAVSWPKILQAVYHNDGVLARSDIFPTSWAAPVLPSYPLDPDHAARLLTAAGWITQSNHLRMRAGMPLSLTIISGNASGDSRKTEELMAYDLAKIGVQLQIKNMPASYLFSQHGPLYGGHYQLAWMSDTRAPDPDNFALWSSTAIPPNGANTVFLRDAQVDAFAASALTAVDRSRRRALYQAEEERLHRLVPSYAFAWQKETIASWGSIPGLQPATYYSSLWNTWQWR